MGSECASDHGGNGECCLVILPGCRRLSSHTEHTGPQGFTTTKNTRSPCASTRLACRRRSREPTTEQSRALPCGADRLGSIRIFGTAGPESTHFAALRRPIPRDSTKPWNPLRNAIRHRTFAAPNARATPNSHASKGIWGDEGNKHSAER